MKVKYLVIGVALTIAGWDIGCAAELVPLPSAGQRVTYNAGRPTVTSGKTNIIE